MVKQGMAERFWVWIIEDGYRYRVPEEHSVNKERIPKEQQFIPIFGIYIPGQ